MQISPQKKNEGLYGNVGRPGLVTSDDIVQYYIKYKTLEYTLTSTEGREQGVGKFYVEHSTTERRRVGVVFKFCL